MDSRVVLQALSPVRVDLRWPCATVDEPEPLRARFSDGGVVLGCTQQQPTGSRCVGSGRRGERRASGERAASVGAPTRERTRLAHEKLTGRLSRREAVYSTRTPPERCPLLIGRAHTRKRACGSWPN